jgi:hypothetical protein
MHLKSKKKYNTIETMYFTTRDISNIQEREELHSRLLEDIYRRIDDGEQFDDAVPHGNIILDVDHTLCSFISTRFAENTTVTDIQPIPRPGLRKFLRFVFAHYERVSIWTAGNLEWYSRVKADVLEPNMPLGASFHFEKTRVEGEPITIVKPLTEIYAVYPEYTAENTLIVDDSPTTFRENIKNAIHVPAFYYDLMGHNPDARRKNAARDNGLYTIIEVLQGKIRHRLFFESLMN